MLLGECTAHATEVFVEKSETPFASRRCNVPTCAGRGNVEEKQAEMQILAVANAFVSFEMDVPVRVGATPLPVKCL